MGETILVMDKIEKRFSGLMGAGRTEVARAIYGADPFDSGEIYIKGNAGYRVGIHMKAYEEHFPVIVIGGKAGDFLGEYQAGGIIIVLGIGCEGIPVGGYCGTGMHGGNIFIRSEEPPKNLPAQVACTECTNEDLKQIEAYVSEYATCFGKDAKELLRPKFYKLLPNSNNPYRQLYVQN